MKSNFIGSLFLCLIVSVLWMGNSLGRAAGGNGNSTVNGCGNNGSCHAGGTFQGATKISITKNGNPVTKYIPGTIYEVELSVEKTGGSGTPAGYGFQLTAARGNKDAGVFSNVAPKGNTQITPLNGRTFVEHNLLIPSGKTTVNWTAPSVGTGNVTFFAAGNLVNGANGTKGDSPTPAITLVLSEGTGVSSEDLPNGVRELKISGHQPQEPQYLSVFSEKNCSADLAIYQMNGQLIYLSSLRLLEGENTLSLDNKNIASGMYILQLKADKQLISKRFIKI